MTKQHQKPFSYNENWMVDTTQAFHYHWWVFRATGIAICQSVSRLARWLYYSYVVAINTVVTVLFPLTLIVRVTLSQNLQQLCENLTITITDLSATIKFVNMFFARRKLYEAEKILSSTLDIRSAGSEQEYTILRSAVTKARNSFRIFWGIYTVGTTISILRVGLTSERALLFPAWFYFDWQNSDVVYAYVFAYQLFGLIVQAVQDCAIDSYPPAYLCVLTGHMQALELRIKRIGQRCMKRDGIFEHRQLEHNYHQLVACIEDHFNILKLYTLIQQILSVSCLSQFICSAVVQCTVALQFLYAIHENDFSSQMISIIFFGAVTLETLLICYFSHQMREESVALSDALYACDWISQLPKFKRSLLITMMRSQKPCTIYAGGYIPVDLITFLSLMKFTYSVFTLLLRFR